MSQSLDRGLDCFLTIARSMKPLTVDEIANSCDIPASSVYRLLRPFEQNELVYRTGDGKRVLGLGVLTLLGSIRNIYGYEFRDIALPVMQELAKKSQESVQLTAFLGFESICMEAVESPQPIRLSVQKGAKQTLGSGCSSKILLAYAEPDFREKVIAQCVGFHRTNGQIVTSEMLHKEIEQIRRDGYVVTVEEIDKGAAGVSVPIFGKEGKILAGLTVTGPEYRFRGEQLDEIIRLVVTSARALSDRCALMESL
jgi:IclR family transcriptional regulator, KDG regulon repressor